LEWCWRCSSPCNSIFSNQFLPSVILLIFEAHLLFWSSLCNAAKNFQVIFFCLHLLTLANGVSFGRSKFTLHWCSRFHWQSKISGSHFTSLCACSWCICVCGKRNKMEHRSQESHCSNHKEASMIISSGPRRPNVRSTHGPVREPFCGCSSASWLLQPHD